MPELPEVETTVLGLRKEIVGYTINDVWTDYASSYKAHKQSIKDASYFEYFKRNTVGAVIKSTSRRGKNVLVHLDNRKTILTHMKMTGHYLVGTYTFHQGEKDPWRGAENTPLSTDSFNRRIHLVFTLTKNKTEKHLALSDMRKFAKVLLVDTEKLSEVSDIKAIGPDALSSEFTYKEFKEALHKRSKGKIKQVLLDQSLIAGIGNIYSGEMLWLARIHPESIVSKIPEAQLKHLYTDMQKVLINGINFGGDSMSDYRNVYGLAGDFQNRHNTYRKTGKPCAQKGCTGTIKRIVVATRSAHFCDTHQVKY
ncbi:MAG TPA: bifunctional DNA-formamidopyrimidine glycosylase/DNA-(apurinic or apyrimidinic site) lyase [Candidatus Paceibacterota bacterium]|nr:bifunctional DNA-formamidopyrimidine glycosylase/DNA-(apurinic or apyrimidinic site) lyase [Candidatus Paceibacterota bacterium]